METKNIKEMVKWIPLINRSLFAERKRQLGTSVLFPQDEVLLVAHPLLVLTLHALTLLLHLSRLLHHRQTLLGLWWERKLKNWIINLTFTLKHTSLRWASSIFLLFSSTMRSSSSRFRRSSSCYWYCSGSRERRDIEEWFGYEKDKDENWSY